MDNKLVNSHSKHSQVSNPQAEASHEATANLNIDGIYQFPQGIPGFEGFKEYKLSLEEDGLLAHLTSEDDASVGFILMKPNSFFGDYLSEVDLDDKNFQTLEASADTIIEVWVILTLNHQDMRKTTANLRAPILLNSEKKIGAQIILHDEKYSSKLPLFKQKELDMEEKGAAG